MLFGKFLFYVAMIGFTVCEELFYPFISIVSGIFSNIPWIMLVSFSSLCFHDLPSSTVLQHFLLQNLLKKLVYLGLRSLYTKWKNTSTFVSALSHSVILHVHNYKKVIAMNVHRIIAKFFRVVGIKILCYT